MSKIFRTISLTHLLLVFYVLLFLILGIVRVLEYRNMRRATLALNELSTASAERQRLVVSFFKSNDLIRVNELEMLYQPTPQRRAELIQNIQNEIAENRKNAARYERLVADSTENVLLKNVLDTKRAINTGRKALLDLSEQTGPAEALLEQRSHLLPLYKKFQVANMALADYVNVRDKSNIATVKGSLGGIVRATRIATLVLVGLLVILGFIIVRVVRAVIRKKNLLAESEKNFQSFIEQSHEIITRIDGEGNIIFANKKLLKLLEYPESELYRLKVFDILSEESRANAQENLRKAAAHKAHSNVFRVLTTKSGKKVQIEGNLTCEYKENMLTRVTGFFNDVTEKRLLEYSLEESQNKFRRFFDLAPIPMYAFHPESLQFLEVNTAAIGHYGYTEQEFLDMTILDIRPESERQKTKDAVSNNPNESEIFTGNYHHITREGTLTDMEIYATRIMLNMQPAILTIAVDITERKWNENRLTQAIIKTQEDERYDIGSELHDNVCQLLAAAKMRMSIIKKSLPVEADGLYQETLETIVMATEEIRNLSHRLAPVFFKNTTLKDAFERLLDTFNLENRYQISFYFDEKLEGYPLSKELQLNLYRILQEQLRNIIKYARATEIRLDVLLYKNKLQMHIADNGVGFDVDVDSKGIGLANMQRRTDFFAGEMEINTSPGNGCEVVIKMQLG